MMTFAWVLMYNGLVISNPLKAEDCINNAVEVSHKVENVSKLTCHSIKLEKQ